MCAWFQKVVDVLEKIDTEYFPCDCGKEDHHGSVRPTS